MSDVKSKVRLFKLIEIFKNQTDEELSVSIDGIVDILKCEYGDDYKIDKRVVKDDIDSLNLSGFEIIEDVEAHNKKKYYYADRDFELYELRMIIDAVSSARFITPKETESLIEKVKALTSNHYAKKLQNQIYLEDRVKCENNSVRFNIDRIHSAISEKHKLKFRYGTYNMKKEFELHHNGEFYYISPYGLYWNKDYYYMIGIPNDKNDMYHFRVDRMKNVDETAETFNMLDFSVSDYVNKTFNMYAGSVEFVEIQFDNDLFNVIIDRFGHDVNIKQYNENSFVVRIEAALSDGFVSWLFSFGNSAKVLSPKSLASKIKEEAIKIVQSYT